MNINRIYNCLIVVLITFVSIESAKAKESDISQGKSIKITSKSGYSDGGNCALDSNINTYCRATSYIDPSGLYNGVWIQVDLKGIYNITKVIVWATNDDSSVNSRYFNIYVRSTNITKYDFLSDEGEFYLNTDLIPKGMSMNYTQPGGMVGRYVTLKKDESHQFLDLSIAEIIVISDSKDSADEYDISRGKSMKISSSSGYADGGTCALDLNINTNCRATEYIDPTGLYNGVWIQIDLKGIFKVTKVIVWATNDDSSVNSGYFNIYVRSTNIIQYDYPLDAGEFSLNTNLIPKGMSRNYTQLGGIEGRYVSLKKALSHLYLDLSIAEIIVISDNKDYIINTIQSTSQSHVFASLVNYNSYNAIDGDVTTCSFTAQEDPTLRTTGGWWLADLGQNYDISAVRIQNRNFITDGLTKFAIYAQEIANGSTKLCYSQNTEVEQSYLNIKCSCDPIVSGRYVQIVKSFVVDRADNLLLCEVNVFSLHSASPVKLPANAIPMSSISSISTSGIMTPFSPSSLSPISLPSLSPISSSPSSASASASSSSSSLSLMTSPSESVYLYSSNSLSCPICEDCSKLKTDKIIIGIVVGILATIVGIAFGILIGYCIFFKRAKNKTTNDINQNSIEDMTSLDYEKTKTQNKDEHDYTSLNQMKEI